MVRRSNGAAGDVEDHVIPLLAQARAAANIGGSQMLAYFIDMALVQAQDDKEARRLRAEARDMRRASLSTQPDRNRL